MKNEEIYNAWKDQKAKIEITSNFSDTAMNRIHQYENKKRQPLFDTQKLIELISAHPLAKTAAIAAGAIAGLVRVGLVVYTYLAC